MSTNVVFYPHAIHAALSSDPFTTLFALNQMTDVEPGHNFQDVTEYASDQVSPMFTGTHQASPDNRFSTPALKVILDAVTAGQHNLCRNLTSHNVDLWYTAGQKHGTRVAYGSASHLRLRMQDNAMLCWESLTARQGGLAELRCRLAATLNAQTGADPLVPTSGLVNNMGIAAGVDDIFTLGPTKLNGTTLEAITEVTIENNIEYEEVASDGDGFLTYVGIRRVRPMLRILSRNSAYLALYGTRGTAITAWTQYFRLKLASGINEPDASLLHIAFTGADGTIKARRISSPDATVEITLDLATILENVATYAIDTTSAVT